MITQLYTFIINCDHCGKQYKCIDKERGFVPNGWHEEKLRRDDGYGWLNQTISVNSVKSICGIDGGRHICDTCHNIKDILE